MASSVKAQKSPGKSILDKLPRLSTSIWLLIVSALVLIIAVPLFLGFYSEISTQTLYNNQLTQLQLRYGELQKQTGSQAALAAEVITLKNDVDKIRQYYGNLGNSIEISQDLIDLAWKYDITINNMTMARDNQKYDNMQFPVFRYVIEMTGQVPAFQNFLLAMGNKLPSSEIKEVIIEPAVMQGKLDKATITVQVYCNLP